MTVSARSQRTVGFVGAAVLVIVGAVIASIAVFGGGTAPDSKPPHSPVARTPTGEPTSGPSPQPSCPLYDLECQDGREDDSPSEDAAQPSTPPDDTDETAGDELFLARG
ncbi:hypothetical protein ACQEVS_10155 [Streptomyces sp. CA-181903]|uniref:hypothetical protein n=1 Tax=Streptomyces sp. CA-181903 TaxID=3240055 RepID=UPI003D8E2223